MKSKSFSKRGFSMIEGLLMVAVFTLAMSLLISFVIYVYRAYGYNFEQIAAINEARKGIEIMVKEIRGAQYGEDGSYPIEEAGNFQFIFYSDIDKDAKIERVRYFLSGTDFNKGVVESSGDPPEYILNNEVIRILSRYVRNDTVPIFVYYNGDWPVDVTNNPLPTLTRLTETKLMHVYLKINVDSNRPPDNFELESDVQIRNLKTNL